MLRTALKGAAVAGAAAMLAVGAASPAMANGSDYVYDADDFGGVNVLSNFCVNNTGDILALLDILSFSGDASCNWSDVNVHANGSDNGGHHGH
ncbi:hypothetical protein [Glycomyces paridis]|uniref:DUF320 domain-containing protein n=1 Tax=Glycomyces paridis TaxID=2126555 RepID=A0A4S8PLV1_9ACTN|nr:hypothetical protein [Glycomyces paridis]THV30735.1 hypothetical protein E9998_04955 [Glycomyces paridis]